MGDQSSHITSDNISETSLSLARSSLTYQSFSSETSYADSLSTSITAREIVSTPNLQGFSFNDLTNAIRSFRFDSLVGQEGFGSSARSSLIARSSSETSLIARSSSETSYAESFSTSIFEGEILSAPKPKAFQLIELKHATRNFQRNLVFGEGRDGILFKGWIDRQTLAATKPGSGMVVAIRKLNPKGFQGLKERLTQVNYLGQLHHPNLVKLIGYCSDEYNYLLVHEFMLNRSLGNHLRPGRGIQPLSWEMRIKVAIGAARGLFFLHEAKTIHGNFKASNILLDVGFGAKLSDFVWHGAVYDCLYDGLTGPTSDLPYGSLEGGTYYLPDYDDNDDFYDCGNGVYSDCLPRVLRPNSVYMAPESVYRGMLRAESDVYSFGVVLLELLFGRCAFDNSISMGERNLVDWAKPYLGDERRLFRIVDRELKGQAPKKGVYMAATVALRCLSTEAKVRPQMAEVLNTLEGIQALKVAANHSNHSNHNSRTVSNPLREYPLRHYYGHHGIPKPSPAVQRPRLNSMMSPPTSWQDAYGSK